MERWREKIRKCILIDFRNILCFDLVGKDEWVRLLYYKVAVFSYIQIRSNFKKELKHI